MSFWYLATPYSKFPGGIEAAFRLACEQAAFLVRHGIPVYSPIAHTHPIATLGQLDPLNHAIWLPADEPLMRAAQRGLIILRAPSWEDSYGIAHERQFFAGLARPIIFMDPNILPTELAVPHDERETIL